MSIDNPDSSPSRYLAEGLECIDAMEAVASAYTEDPAMGMLAAQVLRYLWRAPKKGQQGADIDKALDYMRRIRARQLGRPGTWDRPIDQPGAMDIVATVDCASPGGTWAHARPGQPPASRCICSRDWVGVLSRYVTVRCWECLAEMASADRSIWAKVRWREGVTVCSACGHVKPPGAAAGCERCSKLGGTDLDPAEVREIVRSVTGGPPVVTPVC